MPDNRRNLQINQPGIQGNEQVDQNGWPVPLSDPSNPLRVKVTHGTSGTQKNFQAMSTSNQGDLSLAEGSSSDGTNEGQGGHGNKLHTSQQNAGDHHAPEGE